MENRHTWYEGVCTICNEKKSSEGLSYMISDDHTYCTVTGIGSCEDTNIVIPSKYYNYPVTSIGDRSFWGCSNLTGVTIPNSVTSIGYSAFEYCRSLTSVIFKNASGWWRSNSSTATSGTNISSSDLANASTAATYLKSTYAQAYWKRS